MDTRRTYKEELNTADIAGQDTGYTRWQRKPVEGSRRERRKRERDKKKEK